MLGDSSQRYGEEEMRLVIEERICEKFDGTGHQ